MNACLQCGSERVIPKVRLLDRTAESSAKDLTAEICLHPEAWIFKEPVQASLVADICGSCGYCELYVDSPDALWQMHQARQKLKP
jgi:hypothetical protein